LFNVALDYERLIGLRNTPTLKGTGKILDPDCKKGISYGISFEDRFDLDLFGKVIKLLGVKLDNIAKGCYQ